MSGKYSMDGKERVTCSTCRAHKEGDVVLPTSIFVLRSVMLKAAGPPCSSRSALAPSDSRERDLIFLFEFAFATVSVEYFVSFLEDREGGGERGLEE